MKLGSLGQERFTGNGIVKYMQYNAGKYNSRSNYLEEKKQMLYNLFTIDRTIPLPDGYSSVIKKNDNCEALIVKHEVDEYIQYTIFTLDKSHSKYFNAAVIALKRDIIEADKEVDNFVKNIRFK